MSFFYETELTSEAETADVVDIFQKCLAAAVEHSISNKIQKAHVAAATFSLDGTEIFSLTTCSAGNHAEISAVAAYYGRGNSKKIHPQAGCCFKPRPCELSLRELPLRSPYPQAQLV